MRKEYKFAAVVTALLGVGFAAYIISQPNHSGSPTNLNLRSIAEQQVVASAATVDLAAPSPNMASGGGNNRNHQEGLLPNTSSNDSIIEEPRSFQKISFTDARIENNIIERQQMIASHVDIINGKASAEDWTPALSSAAATLLSVQVIHDATGKSYYPPASNDGSDEQVLSRENSGWSLSGEDAYHMTSGGVYYEVPKGEFPAFDVMQDMEDAGLIRSMTAEEIPVSAVMDLVSQAQSYKVQR